MANRSAMATTQEMQTRLDEIETHLATGATTTVIDGVTVTVDLVELRRERRRLQEALQLVPRRRRAFNLTMGTR